MVKIFLVYCIMPKQTKKHVSFSNSNSNSNLNLGDNYIVTKKYGRKRHSERVNFNIAKIGKSIISSTFLG